MLSAALLKDINTEYQSSDPRNLIDVDGRIYFVANAPATGAELYTSDGTAAGTRLVRDIFPGESVSSIRSMTRVGDVLFFVATDPVNGTSLWKDDGGPAGAVIVANLRGDRQFGGDPAQLVDVDGTLFFTTYFEDAGYQLWRSDGTAAGTVRVGGVPSNSPILRPTAAGGFLFYGQVNGANEAELWRTDGTEAGTTRLKTFGPINATDPVELVAAGDTLFFNGWDAARGYGLWKSDGTESGTTRIADVRIYRNPADGSPAADDVGQTLYFLGTDATHGRELWKSDGTPGGTTLVQDVVSGTGHVNPTSLVAAADGVFFFGEPHPLVDALYYSDGTGVDRLATHSSPFQDSSYFVDRLTTAGSSVFYVNHVAGRPELWRSDGTVEGTGVVERFAGTIPAMARFGDGVAFAASQASAQAAAGVRSPGTELWKSDGTAAGTVLVSDVNTATADSMSVDSFGAPVPTTAVLGDRVVFFARDASKLSQLWSTDGTPAGTTLLVNAPPFGFFPGTVGVLGNAAYAFTGGTTNSPGSMWRTDGTAAGSSKVVDVFFNPYVVEFNGALYFQGDSPADRKGFELFKTDGTAAGTVRVKDITAGPGGSSLGEFTPAGAVMFFTRNFATTGGNELWKTDGTEAGTVLVKSFLGGAAATRANRLTNVGDTLFFRARGAGGNDELWKSDGTPDGTVRVRRFGAPPLPSTITPPPSVALDGKLVFVADDGAGTGQELWISDGTEAGTVLLKDISPGAVSSNSRFLTAYRGAVYFSAAEPATGQELWRTDGTAEGTRLAIDYLPGPESSNALIRAAAQRLYFVASGSDGVARLVESDGTAAGTNTIAEGVSGPTTFGRPASATPFGDKLFFSMDDGEHGREPWAADITPAAPEIAGRHIVYANSPTAGSGGVTGAPRDVAPDKTALLPGQRATFANVSSYSRGINAMAIDVWDLAADPAAADFEVRVSNGADTSRWSVAAAPTVSVARGAGVGGSDRITLVWADGTIRNRWLRVTVKPTAATGLTTADVFHFGSLVGDTGAGGDRPGLRVDSLDLAAVRRGFSSDASDPANRLDFNRDGRVTAADYALARFNLSASLGAFVAPAANANAPVAAQRSALPATRLLTDPVPRRGRYDVPG